MMTSGGETTLEDEIIYTPEIEALILETVSKLAAPLEGNMSRRMQLESLVVRSIQIWTGE